MFTIEYLRSFRIGGYAIFDFAVSYIGVALLSPLLSKLFRLVRLDIPKKNWLFFVLPVSIIVHISVGTITPFAAAFLDINGHFVLKAIVLVSLVLGIRGIKIIR